MRTKTLLFAILMACAALAVPALLPADPVAVRYAEGLVHGFLTLRTLDGTLVANGDLIQIARGDQVTTQLVFHFKDGSLYDETAIFSQRGHFRLVSNHLVQKGSTFPQPLDMTINTGNGLVTVHYKGDDGKEKVENEKLDLPADLANGMMMVLLKNVDARNLPPTVSYVAATPKPRLVKMAISAAGADPFSMAGSSRRATHYVLKVQIGGLAGIFAPMVGKQPPDDHVWILEGEAPAFVKSEGPLFLGGPSWRIELTNPVWPVAQPAAK